MYRCLLLHDEGVSKWAGLHFLFITIKTLEVWPIHHQNEIAWKFSPMQWGQDNYIWIILLMYEMPFRRTGKSTIFALNFSKYISMAYYKTGKKTYFIGVGWKEFTGWGSGGHLGPTSWQKIPQNPGILGFYPKWNNQKNNGNRQQYLLASNF